MLTIDSLAQEIRRVDGNHSLGAGALAEALMPFLSALSEQRAVEVKALHRLDIALCNFINAYGDPYDPPEEYEAETKRNIKELSDAYNAAHSVGVLKERSALVNVPAVAPVAIGYVSSVDLHLLKQSAAVVDLFSKPEPGPIEFIPVFTSPPLSREGEASAEVKDAHETVQKLCDMHGTLLRILDEKVGLKVFMSNEVSSLASLLLDAATKLDRVNRAALAATRSGSAEGDGE